MHSGDILGEIGRKALNACVKIVVVGSVGIGKTVYCKKLYQDFKDARIETSKREPCLHIRCDEREKTEARPLTEPETDGSSDSGFTTEGRATERNPIEIPTEKIQHGSDDVCDVLETFETDIACCPIGDFFHLRYPVQESKEEPEAARTGQETQNIHVREPYIDGEIVHGSGFMVHDHFVITCMHVIKTALGDQMKTSGIFISNAVIGDLPCEIAHIDYVHDLALLYCEGLHLWLNEIRPLLLSDHSLSPGMPIFCFGYPLSYTGERALIVNGTVYGLENKFASHSPSLLLNCPLNTGNSGGPVLSWINNHLKVIGVAQQYFDETLTLDERNTIKKIGESLKTNVPSNGPDSEVQSSTSGVEMSESYLILRLHDALERHSYSDTSKALPVSLVVQFIKDSIVKYTGKFKEELHEIVKWVL